MRSSLTDCCMELVLYEGAALMGVRAAWTCQVTGWKSYAFMKLRDVMRRDGIFFGIMYYEGMVTRMMG